MKQPHISKVNLVFFIIIIISVCLLSIGYATYEPVSLDIAGEITAVPQSDVYITDIVYESNTDANIENSKIDKFYQSLMESTIVLGNSTTSSITYSVTVYNSSDSDYTFKNVEYSDEFYDNPNIVFELNGLKQWDTVASKQSYTFSITFHYLNNTIPENKVLNSYLNFKFILGSNDDTNIVTDNHIYTIYNASTDNTLSFDVTNANDFAVTFNLKLNNTNIKTLSLNPSQSATIEYDITNMLSSFQPNQEYPVIIEQSSPYVVTKTAPTIVKLIPTMTNYDLGLKTAGSQQNPYVLYKIEDLVRLAKNVNSGTTFASSNIKMLNDLDFNNASDYYNSTDTSFGNLNEVSTDSNEILNEMTTGTGFIMIGNSETNSFQGTFDGDNNTINNIYINKTGDTVDTLDTPYGLFRAIKNATIQNTNLTGNYTFEKDGSAFSGNIYGITKLSNCHTSVNITNSAKDKSIGGLLGTLQGSSTNVTIDNCSNHGHIINNSGAAGGLVGFVISSKLTVSNSYNTGDITVNGVFDAEQFAAGLVVKDSSGGADITINNSYNNGEIKCLGNGTSNVGGLVSLSVGTLTINSCYNSGTVTGNVNVGGILGSHRKPWSTTGAIGIATISNSYNVGKVTGNSSIGGIIGQDTGNKFDVSRAYYLEDGSLLNVGTIANNNSCSRTSTYMKSSEFITLLGNQFIMDSSPLKNNGYPIIKNLTYK